MNHFGCQEQPYRGHTFNMDKIHLIFRQFASGHSHFVSAWKNKKDADAESEKLGSQQENQCHFGYYHIVKTVTLK